MKILGIEHIGIAVNDLVQGSSFWKLVLGLKHTGKEQIASQGVVTDIYDTGKGKIELLEALNDESPIAKYLDKRGTGMHHLCLEVKDIKASIKELNENNIQIIGDNYSIGAEGYKVIFIHPKSTGGVLVELEEKPKL